MKPSVRKKLRPIYAGFLATFLIAAVFLNFLYLIYYSYNARKLDNSERSKILNQTVFYTDRFMKEVEDWANTLTVSSQVQALMTYRNTKNYLDYVDCMEVLGEHAMTIPGIYRIDLYVQNSQTLLTSYEGVYYDLPEEERGRYEEYVNTEKSWFWDIYYQGTEPRLVTQTRNVRYITLIKPVFSKYTGKKNGALCISVALSELQDLIHMENTEQEGICLTYDGETLWGEVPKGHRGRQMSQTSQYTGMEFDYYYMGQLPGILSAGFLLSIVLILLFFGAVFLSIIKISERRMFDPAASLLEGFQEVENGRFGVRLENGRDDLFRELFQGFNHMAERLERMIEELSTERERRNEFKYRLLQMQIKPHFLYNLFNNMIWMVEQKDYERLEVLIQSTAGYYKTALNYGDRNIMLVENQRQLEYYAEIQKIRFGDHFRFEVDFPDEVKFYSIPNLLLQPLVENAMVHGLKEKKEQIVRIVVKASQKEDMLVLTVTDDGCGIPPEILEDIRQETENYEKDGSKYFALVNVAARIHNCYKERARFQIDSSFGQGCEVTISIPLDEVR